MTYSDVQAIRDMHLTCPSCDADYADLLGKDHYLAFREPDGELPAEAECRDGKPVSAPYPTFEILQAIMNVRLADVAWHLFQLRMGFFPLTRPPRHPDDCKCYSCGLDRWESAQPPVHNCRFEYCTAPTGQCPNPE